MKDPLTELFATPGMRFVWGVGGVLFILIVLANKFAPDPADRRIQGIRQVVFEATGIRPSSSGFVLWQVLAWILPMACFAGGMLLNVRSLMQRQGQSVVGWLLIAIFLLSAILMSKARYQGAFWIYQKLLRADYEGAVARADLLIRWFPGTPAFHFIRGTVLLFAGRLAEADESLRTSIAKSLIQAGSIVPGGLSNLAAVELRLGRFRAATAALEAATKLYPRFSGVHNGLAEVLLSQGLEPRRALLLVDNALKLKEGNVRTRNVDRHSTAYMWANRAQALAMLGQKEEAASSVTTAQSAGDPAFLPGLAGTYWRCGVALRLMEQENAALEQFRKAAGIDPHGLYGKLAGSALHEYNVHR